MTSKIARLLGAAALVAAPMLASSSAHAAAGCSVDNASTNFQIEVHIEIPPGSATHHFTSEECSYVSNGGNVNIKCTITAGRCITTVNGVEAWRCTTVNSICTNTIAVNPGDTVSLTVDGGSGSVTDAA